MPAPRSGENQDEFIRRCIPMMINEGKESDQAVAICHSLWDSKLKNKKDHEQWLSKLKDNYEKGIPYTLEITKGKYHRFRIEDPEDFDQNTFRTIEIGDGIGINAVVGRLSGEDTMTIQAYLFDANQWSLEEARSWLDDHDIEYQEDEVVEGVADQEKKYRRFYDIVKGKK